MAESFPFTEDASVAGPIVGASGAVGAGTTAFEVDDGALVPRSFVATTTHVYVLPFVNPDTRIGLAVPDAETASPPAEGVHVAVYAATGLPPLSVGAVNATFAASFCVEAMP